MSKRLVITFPLSFYLQAKIHPFLAFSTLPLNVLCVAGLCQMNQNLLHIVLGLVGQAGDVFHCSASIQQNKDDALTAFQALNCLGGSSCDSGFENGGPSGKSLFAWQRPQARRDRRFSRRG